MQPPATFRLNELSVKLLVERGDTDALRACADAGNWQAREPLVQLLVERDDIDALRAYADAGESWAAHRLVDVLAERGDFEAPRARADAGDSHAAGRVAERGDFEALRARADAGDSFAAYWLPELSARHLAERGDLDELRARADAGDYRAKEQFVELCIERGDLDPLRVRASYSRKAALRLIDYWQTGATSTSCALSLTTATATVARIVELLAELGDLEGVRNEVIAGNPSAGPRLITELSAGSPGQRAEATRLRHWGLRPHGSVVRNDAEYE